MREFLDWVKEWFGSELPDLEIFPSGKEKLRACSRELRELEVRDFTRGIYIAKKAPYGFIISIEGSFLIGRGARKHVADISDEEFRRWMRGEDLEKDLPEKGVYLVRYGDLFAGSGYYDGKVLRNLVPKVRTLEAGSP